jgi:hypothetical protein
LLETAERKSDINGLPVGTERLTISGRDWMLPGDSGGRVQKLWGLKAPHGGATLLQDVKLLCQNVVAANGGRRLATAYWLRENPAD